ncbi:MAG: serine/threonine protein kinase [Planctomycetes bacterium]|nr:serine/threonine protein kinase [Planctomycetota bacterium]
MDSEIILHRFHDEMQFQAALGKHPYIAQMIDAGETEDGFPYFVMEYVDGERIDSWCDRQRLPVKRRLALFQEVCGAVQFAHQNTVIHRDLKPSNILVTVEGRVKLLDFGIARLLSSEGSLATVELTVPERRLLTPRYASPEQIRGESLTTASDVYSLGVILFELLTGSAPYRLTSRAREECERAVCEQQPLRPSDALTQTRTTRGVDSGPAPTARTERDPHSLRRWRRALRGDLDNIVLKALRKESSRRYSTAELLAEDLRAYLDHRPVSARPDTWLYRTRKFVGRNLALVSSAVVVVSALALGFALSYGAYRRESAALDDARRQEEIAGATVDFLERMLAGVTPEIARGRDVTVLREILEEAAQRLESDLGNRPEVAARIANTIGSVYHAMGDEDRAETFARLALEHVRRALPKGHPREAASLTLLGSVLGGLGRLEEAVAALRESLAMRRAADDPIAAGEPLAWNELGLALKRSGQYEEAEKCYRTALAMVSEHDGERSLQAALVLHNLGRFLQDRGRVEEAASLLERVVEIRREQLPPDHYLLSVSLQVLSGVKTTLGEREAAVALADEAVKIQRKVLGPDHPNLAAGLQALGFALADVGDRNRMLDCYREAAAILRRAHDGDHPETARAIANLAAQLARSRDHLDEAETLHREALAMRRALYPDGHPDTAVSLEGLAGVFLERGRFAEARPLYDEALAIRRKVLPDDHPLIALSMHNIGYTLYGEHNYDDAERFMRDALVRRERLFRADDSRVALSRFVYGRILLDMGQTEKSVGVLREAVDAYATGYGQGHAYVARASSFLGAALLENGEREEAGRVLHTSVDTLRERTGPNSAWTLQAEKFLERWQAARTPESSP